MNHPWTKEIVYELNSVLKEKSIVWYNSVMFVQLRSIDEDFVLRYFKSLMTNIVGASAWTMIRKGFQDSKDQGHDSGILNFILHLIPAEMETFSMIIITEEVHSLECKINLDFSLAHELSHVVHRDIALDNVVEQGSPEYHAREMRADKFAIELLGTASGAVDTMEYVVELVENADPIARGIPVDRFELAKKQLKERMSAIYEMVI